MFYYTDRQNNPVNTKTFPRETMRMDDIVENYESGEKRDNTYLYLGGALLLGVVVYAIYKYQSKPKQREASVSLFDY
jgi:hypothetical protein